MKIKPLDQISMNRLIVSLTLLSIPFANYKLAQVFGAPIYITEVFVTILLIVHTIETFKKSNSIQNIKIPRWFVGLVSVLMLGLLVSIFANHPSSSQFGILKAWFLFPILFGYIIYKYIQSPKMFRDIIFVWLFSFLIIVLIALYYSFSGQFTYDHRLRAFYLSPNYLALFLLPVLFLLKYYFSLLSRTSRYYQITLFFLSLSFIATLFVLYQTQSYTTLLSIATTVLLSTLFLHRKQFSLHKRTSMLLLIIIVLTAYIYMQLGSQKFQDLIHVSERSSLSSRIMIWRTSSALIHDNFFTGIGPGNFQEKYLEYQKFYPLYLEWAVPQPHNLYLAFWLQTGLLGLIGFLMLLWSWFYNMLPFSQSKDQFDSLAAIVLIEIIIATLIAGITDTPYWKSDLAYTFWLTIFLGVRLLKMQKLQGLPAIQKS